MINYPALHYSHEISDLFSKVKFINIPDAIQSGLKNEIIIEDLDGGLSDYSSIDDKGQVYLSATYAQIIWFISYVALYVHDYVAVVNEIKNFDKKAQQQFLREIEQRPDWKLYLIDLFKTEKCHELLDKITQMIEKLVQDDALTKDEISFIEGFDLDSPLCSKVGRIFCFSIVFVLLHEFSHYSLKHDFSNNGDISEEVDADDNAFIAMVSDFLGKHEFGANIGIITALASILFINNDLKDDGVHPSSDKRLFNYYDQISILLERGDQYMVIMLTLWALCFHKDDFPSTLKPF